MDDAKYKPYRRGSAEQADYLARGKWSGQYRPDEEHPAD